MNRAIAICNYDKMAALQLLLNSSPMQRWQIRPIQMFANPKGWSN